MRVFESRLIRYIDQLKKFRILVKLSGATGNYNAHVAAYPDIDWIQFTEGFIESLNAGRIVLLEVNPVTTQIEPHDTYADLFDILKKINTVLIDFNQDVWRYISDGWISQKPKAGEVGSSTMPHKVNPIDFENSEGNLGIANALFQHFGNKLPISRLQRDLSDSTVERNFGVALGHSLVGYNSMLKGLGKISVNEEKMMAELDNHPEVVSEAIQTVLRAEGVKMPYEASK
jgi:adenylosuccinate lyase